MGFAIIVLAWQGYIPIPPLDIAEWLESENYPWEWVYMELGPGKRSPAPVGILVGDTIPPIEVASFGIGSRFTILSTSLKVLDPSAWHFLPNEQPLAWLKSRFLSLL